MGRLSHDMTDRARSPQRTFTIPPDRERLVPPSSTARKITLELGADSILGLPRTGASNVRG